MALLRVCCWILFLSLGVVACTNGAGPSEAEKSALKAAAFSSSFNVHEQVGDVYSIKDAIPASRPFHVNEISDAIELPIRDCTIDGLYEMEKQMALTEAAADESGQTIPVKFSYSFGKKHDGLAKAANQRAILSASNGGVSYIPVGGKKTSTYGGKHAYYPADNREVARQYRTGERCFFSTIKVNADELVVSPNKYDFIKVSDSDPVLSADLLRSKKTASAKRSYLKHMIHYMYYGYCKVGRCAPDQAFAGEFANRLFGPVPSVENGDPQIIKLYVADLRSEQMQHDIVRLSEDTTRGLEIDSSIDNILDVCAVHKNYHDLTKNLSLPKEVNGYHFDPINGAAQLVNNILSHDVDGTMLSSQYTPIVIDLDGDGVKTSSVRWGTYFNMAALENNGNAGESHRSAWLGGDYVDENLNINDSRVNLDVRLRSRDGFLVIPDDQGQVTSSTQMFGDNMIVGGKTYENGFQALQAFAGKNCESVNVEHRYVGPWDDEIYSDKLKIWVDANRNGVSDLGEIASLRDHGIAAINACHILHTDETDAFGNGTHLRSAVLMAGPYSYLLDSEREIVNHLEYGQGLDGERSYFNLAIDLIFKVKTADRCEGAPKNAVDYPAATIPDDDIGISSGDPVPVTPPEPTEPDRHDDTVSPNRPDNF